jgi:hypothetical protein
LDSLITHAVIGDDAQTGDYFAHAFETTATITGKWVALMTEHGVQRRQ